MKATYLLRPLLRSFAAALLLSLPLAGMAQSSTAGAKKQPAPLRTTDDGTTVVNTTSLARDVKGHSGQVPVEIYIKKGKVQKIVPFRNAETPTFFERVWKELGEKWNNRKPAAARKLKVDAVSGATQSSRAVIENVNRGLDYYISSGKKAATSSRPARRTDAVSGASPRA